MFGVISVVLLCARNKALGVYLSCFLACCLFSLASHSEVESSFGSGVKSPPINYLIYGRSAEPYQIIDRPGQVSGMGRGIVTDLVVEIFRDSPYQLKPVIKPVKRIKREMAAGAVKNWITYGFRSWESLPEWRHVAFADSDLLPYSLSLATRRDNIREQGLVKDLKGQDIIWIHGYSYAGLEQFIDTFKVRFEFAKNHMQAIKMLAQQRKVFFMENEERIRYAMKKVGVTESDFAFLSMEPYVKSTQLTLIMGGDMDPEMRDFVNQRLARLLESGYVAEAANRYRGANSEQAVKQSLAAVLKANPSTPEEGRANLSRSFAFSPAPD